MNKTVQSLFNNEKLNALPYATQSQQGFYPFQLKRIKNIKISTKNKSNLHLMFYGRKKLIEEREYKKNYQFLKDCHQDKKYRKERFKFFGTTTEAFKLKKMKEKEKNKKRIVRQTKTRTNSFYGKSPPRGIRKKRNSNRNKSLGFALNYSNYKILKISTQNNFYNRKIGDKSNIDKGYLLRQTRKRMSVKERVFQYCTQLEERKRHRRKRRLVTQSTVKLSQPKSKTLFRIFPPFKKLEAKQLIGGGGKGRTELNKRWFTEGSINNNVNQENNKQFISFLGELEAPNSPMVKIGEKHPKIGFHRRGTKKSNRVQEDKSKFKLLNLLRKNAHKKYKKNKILHLSSSSSSSISEHNEDALNPRKKSKSKTSHKTSKSLDSEDLQKITSGFWMN